MPSSFSWSFDVESRLGFFFAFNFNHHRAVFRTISTSLSLLLFSAVDILVIGQLSHLKETKNLIWIGWIIFLNEKARNFESRKVMYIVMYQHSDYWTMCYRRVQSQLLANIASNRRCTWKRISISLFFSEFAAWNWCPPPPTPRLCCVRYTPHCCCVS